MSAFLRPVVLLAAALGYPLAAVPASADDVCDFLRRKIVWTYAIGQVEKLVAPVVRADGTVVESRRGSGVEAASGGEFNDRMWMRLYSESKCSSRRLAEDLWKADEIVAAKTGILAANGTDIGVAADQ